MRKMGKMRKNRGKWGKMRENWGQTGEGRENKKQGKAEKRREYREMLKGREGKNGKIVEKGK